MVQLNVWHTLVFGTLHKQPGDIFKLKKDQIKAMKVPALKPADAGPAIALFKSIGDDDFRPYAAEFLRAAQGKGPRKKIDTFLKKKLGLPQISSTIYGALAIDPVVSKQPLA